FHPIAVPVGAPARVGASSGLDAPAAGTRRVGRLITARIRPNQEIGAALVALCARHGVARATVRGSLGSLIGAGFTDGRVVPDPATEVLVRHGSVAPGADGALAATLDLVVVDAEGRAHEGRLAAGENSVCITFELMVEAG
ncbi:MAG: PCC domain-containing protein, partial [Acetobacteraceae bacterium]